MFSLNKKCIRRNKRYFIFDYLLEKINYRRACHNINKYPRLAVYSFDHIGLLVNQYGIVEKETLEDTFYFLSKNKLFDPTGICIDVGANIGNHSIYFSKIFRKVISFEPAKKIYQLLEINTQDHENIKTYNIGLGSESCSKTINYNKLNLGNSKIYEIGSPEYDKDSLLLEEVKIESLDNLFLESEEKISMIKIDIEGYESFVFKGGKKTILKHKPIILFEHFEEIKKNKDRNFTTEYIKDPDEFLSDIGYQLYTLERGFYLGENYILRLLSVLLRSIFGEQKVFKNHSKLSKSFHELVVALPSEKLINFRNK